MAEIQQMQGKSEVLSKDEKVVHNINDSLNHNGYIEDQPTKINGTHSHFVENKSVDPVEPPLENGEPESKLTELKENEVSENNAKLQNEQKMKNEQPLENSTESKEMHQMSENSPNETMSEIKDTGKTVDMNTNDEIDKNCASNTVAETELSPLDKVIESVQTEKPSGEKSMDEENDLKDLSDEKNKSLENPDDKNNSSIDKDHETSESKKDDSKLSNIDKESSKDSEKKMTPDEKSSTEELDAKLKSVDKVTDVDGSEILITINEEHEESENEDGNSNNLNKKENKDSEKKKSETNSPKGASSNKAVIIKESFEAKKKLTVSPIAPKPLVPVNSGLIGEPPVSTAGLQSVKLPIISGSQVQYIVPSSIPTFPTAQQKYINVNGQQIFITLPPSSLSQALNTSTAANPIIQGNLNTHVNVFTGFPPPNVNKSPFDKSLDYDVPQASWEQMELIKFEVVSRKPDNAFWGGLANVSRKADLSGVSRFLQDIGSDLVKESAYEQIVQVQQKKEDADALNDNEKESLQRMKKVVEEIKEKLKFLNDLPTYTCSCGYTTTSKNVMFLHKQHPHVIPPSDKNGYTVLKCAHCEREFGGRYPDDNFKVHMVKDHRITPRLPQKSPIYVCNLCQFDGCNKNTLVKHKFRCLKNFKQHLNQAPHHVDINLCMKNIFYKFQVSNKKLQSQQQQLVSERIDTRVSKSLLPQRPMIQPKTNVPRLPQVDPNRPIIPPIVSNVAAGKTWTNSMNRVSSVQYAQRPPPQPITNKPTVNQLLKTQTQSSSVSTNRSGFEVCEICGGYVKDRMSLRIHFFYAHKIEMPAHVFSKVLAPLFCSICNERFWTSQGFTKHQSSTKHINNMRSNESATNQCWICQQKPENLYSHLHKFHRLTTSECMALKRCMFCGVQSKSRKNLELHMAATHGVMIKGEENKPAPPPPVTAVPSQVKPQSTSNVTTKNLSTVVTGGSSGMVRNNFCVFCSAQFQDNTKLTLHCLSVHATCKKCGMVVNKNTDLARHVCKMSSKTCSICGMKNLKPAGLIKHLESHTKPCRVALKRLSPSMIEKATGGKYRRLDTTIRSGSGINVYENRSTKLKNMNRGKVVIDLSGNSGRRKEEVVIESDDSDVIIEEEEKTEIVLDDSDNEEKELISKTEEKKLTSKSEKKEELTSKSETKEELTSKSEKKEEITSKTEKKEKSDNTETIKKSLGETEVVKKDNETGEKEKEKENKNALTESDDKKESLVNVEKDSIEAVQSSKEGTEDKLISELEGIDVPMANVPENDIKNNHECSKTKNSSEDSTKDDSDQDSSVTKETVTNNKTESLKRSHSDEDEISSEETDTKKKKYENTESNSDKS